MILKQSYLTIITYYSFALVDFGNQLKVKSNAMVALLPRLIVHATW